MQTVTYEEMMRRVDDGEAREHRLKCWTPYFWAICSGDKAFDVRRDDRGFQKGDLVILQEFDPKRDAVEHRKYTGNSAAARISYILTGGQFGIEPGHVVLGLHLLPDAPDPIEQDT